MHTQRSKRSKNCRSVAQSAEQMGNDARGMPSGSSALPIELRLMGEFWCDALDIPDDFYPTFLESLHFQPVAEAGDSRRSPPTIPTRAEQQTHLFQHSRGDM